MFVSPPKFTQWTLTFSVMVWHVGPLGGGWVVRLKPSGWNCCRSQVRVLNPQWSPTEMSELRAKKGLLQARRTGRSCSKEPNSPIGLWKHFLATAHHSMWKFPGQRSNPCHSSNPSHRSKHAGSLTCWANQGRELQGLWIKDLGLMVR